MASVFYPKKAKVELRNKRRRKEKLLKSGTAEDDGNIGVVASKHDEAHLKLHDGNSSSGRKRTADQRMPRNFVRMSGARHGWEA